MGRGQVGGLQQNEASTVLQKTRHEGGSWGPTGAVRAVFCDCGGLRDEGTLFWSDDVRLTGVLLTWVPWAKGMAAGGRAPEADY